MTDKIPMKSMRVDEKQPLLNEFTPRRKSIRIVRVLAVEFVHKERKRLRMSLLSFLYCVTAVLNLWTILYQLQPEEYAITHEAIRIGLGGVAQYMGENSIRTYKDFWTFIIEQVLGSFFEIDTDTDGNDRFFQNYIHVWQGLLLFQWKRIPAKNCQQGGVCYGLPAYTNQGDAYDAGIKRIIDIIQEGQTSDNENLLDFVWLHDDNATSGSDPIIDGVYELQGQQWVNKTTSVVFIVMLLYNPSLLTTTSVITSVEWGLGGQAVTKCQIYSFSNVYLHPINSMFVLIVQVLSFASILGLLIFEGIKAFWSCWNNHKPNLYYSHLSMVVGVLASTIVTVTIIVQWLMLLTSSKYSGNLPLQKEHDIPLYTYLQTLQEFDSIYTFLYTYRLLISLNVILFTGRLLSLLSYYDAIANINTTLEVVFWPALTVSAYVLIILIAASAISTVNFGTDSTYYSLFSTSFLTLVRFLSMGDYDFEGIEATQVNKAVYIAFYFVFILVCVCILFNMFIAIVYEAFDTTKMYRISLKGHGSQIYRTCAIIRHCLWPNSVINMLKNPSKDLILTKEEMLVHILDPAVVTKILEIYGHIPTPPSEDDSVKTPYIL